MAYNFNGYEVGLVLKVGSYEHSVCTQFSATVDGQPASYQQITADEFVRLEEADRAKRVKAFYAFLSSKYNANIEELVKLNPEFPDRRQNEGVCKPKEKPILIKAFGTYGKVNGVAELEREYAKNEICTLNASTDNSYATFDGWYVNGEKISHSSETYSFTVTESVTIEARYANNEFITIDKAVSKQHSYDWLGNVKKPAFTIEATSAWEIAEASSWMLLSHSTGSGGATAITVDAEENRSATARTGTVIFSLKNGLGSCTLRATQAKAEPINVYLDVDFYSSGKFKVVGMLNYPSPVPISIGGYAYFNFTKTNGASPFAGDEYDMVQFSLTIEKGSSQGESTSIEPGIDYSPYFSEFRNLTTSPSSYGGQTVRAV